MLNLQFKMRVNKKEKNMIRFVSKRFQRTQTDMIKVLVKEVYKLLRAEEQPIQSTKERATVG